MDVLKTAINPHKYSYNLFKYCSFNIFNDILCGFFYTYGRKMVVSTAFQKWKSTLANKNKKLEMMNMC